MAAGEGPRLWAAATLAAAAASAAAGLALGLEPSAAALLAGALVLAAAWAVWLWTSAPSQAARQRDGREAQVFAEAAAFDVLRRIPEPCLVVNAASRVAMANDAAAAFFGLADGRPLAAVLRAPAILDAVARSLDGGPAEDVEFELPVPVSRHIEAHVTALPAGADPRALVLMRDVTAVRRVERMRADFVANASHELRTPLASLAGFIETLRGPARDDAEARDRFLEIMEVQAARMRRLIDDLLSLSRIELNEHVRPEGRVDLRAVFRDVLDGAQPQIEAARATVRIEAAADVPPVTGDRDELVQVVQNLLDNAIKYAAEGGEIRLTLAAREPDLTLGPEPLVAMAVADQGPGIAREHLPRLTERFYRVDDKTSRERGGTGLGLAIVKHIVNRHLGRLEIDSAPGEGSRFTVLLPRFKPRAIGGD